MKVHVSLQAKSFVCLEVSEVKRVIVGSGYISEIFREHLSINYGESCTVLDLKDGLLFDITDAERFPQFQNVFEGAVVYITAAISSDSRVKQDLKLAVSTNVSSVLRLVEYLVTSCTVKGIIFASSEWVYGRFKNSLIASSDLIESDYAKQKLCGELLIQQLCKAYAVPCIVARLGIVWGGRRKGGACESVASACVDAARAGIREIEVGHERNARRFVHVRDLAEGLTQLHTEPCGIYDMTGLESIEIGDVVRICGDYLDFDFTIINRELDFNSRVLSKESIRSVNYTWQKKSFEDNLKGHLREFYSQ